MPDRVVRLVVGAIALSWLCWLSAAAPVYAAATPNDDRIEDLHELADPVLQTRLETALKREPHWRRLIAQKRLSVGLIDLSQERVRFAHINGDIMMYAASLPKIAILLAAYQSFEDGSLEETEEIHRDLADMIRVSSNDAATRMIDRIGFDKVAKTLRDHRLYDRSRGGGLWVGKRYARQGKRVGDPLFNISHGATATQASRFYYLLERGRLISPERSRQMLQDLSEPALRHKFVNAVSRVAPDARLYRKSGTWKNWHADSIMVKGRRWRNYILVAITRSASGETIIRNILGSVEEILHPVNESR